MIPSRAHTSAAISSTHTAPSHELTANGGVHGSFASGAAMPLMKKGATKNPAYEPTMNTSPCAKFTNRSTP
jgi:hypothetical protein